MGMAIQNIASRYAAASLNPHQTPNRLSSGMKLSGVQDAPPVVANQANQSTSGPSTSGQTTATFSAAGRARYEQELTMATPAPADTTNMGDGADMQFMIEQSNSQKAMFDATSEALRNSQAQQAKLAEMIKRTLG